MRLILLILGLCLSAAVPLQAQTPTPQANVPPIDSIAVKGNTRVAANLIVQASGLILQQRPSYRDIQRGIAGVYRTGNFDDVMITQERDGAKTVLVITVKERPLLASWSVVGASKVSEGSVRDRVKLMPNRPIDHILVAQGAYSIDSLYHDKGYYAARVRTFTDTLPNGQLTVRYEINEGERVAVAQVIVEGQQKFSEKEIVSHMSTQPEGFWWWQSGEYDEEKVEADMRENLPAWYASKGYIDFQVTGDSLVADSTSSKATLMLSVEEGRQYLVGTFDIIGNRAYSAEELMQFFPFGTVPPGGAPVRPTPFDRVAWTKATDNVQRLYGNSGYIYAQVVPEEIRRFGPDSTPIVDLRWNIREGQVATIGKINIVGNDVTHERVIREAIVIFPGQVFNQDALIRSYQNISNLGFFQQPMPPPDVVPSENKVDVDITFRVEERRTGNINFGASLGQGTGIGGFIGLEEPNLFGRGKRGRLQWQFGRNIQDLNLSYTDPNIRESRISGTISVFDSRARYIVGDLGRRQQLGFSLQAGFPLLGARYTRLFTSYGLQKISYSEGSEDLRERFQCTNCTRSTLGASVVKDTRVGLPFATAGTLVSVGGEINGGPLGGTGNYQKIDLETRLYAPLGTIGGSGALGSGVQLVLGFTARSGFIFGDAGPFFTEMYALGGVQFGIPLRGYPEFSITPNGYDPTAATNTASPNAFGKSFAAFSVEVGARVSQFLYLSTFMDAGNNYRTPAQWDPTRLFRGAGLGVAVISPLGPIGVDLGYGFDRVDLLGRPIPGWQVHFRIGNFF
jgi:outer membrane protein insertion porin family